MGNPEMISSKQEDVCRLYGNTMPFYIKDLSILGFRYLQGVLEPNLRGTTVLTFQDFSRILSCAHNPIASGGET